MSDQEDKIAAELLLKINHLKEQNEKLEQAKKEVLLNLKKERIQRVIFVYSANYKKILYNTLFWLCFKLENR